jgi:methionyl aminopeptidase
LAKIITRITFVGALFLGVIAVLPIIMQSITGIQTSRSAAPRSSSSFRSSSTSRAALTRRSPSASIKGFTTLVIAKTPEDFNGVRAAGKALAEVLSELKAMVADGVRASELDLKAEEAIRRRGAVPAFLGYRPEGAAYPFPATLCVSINDEVVHGIPTEDKVLQDGDIVMLDLGLSLDGYFADAAITVSVGEPDEKTTRLMNATREALSVAIDTARVGNTTGDIGAAVEAVAKKYGYKTAEDLGGHALGKKPHEPPYIPNIGPAKSGEKLKEGMVLALEPIFTEGNGHIQLDPDEWTYRTADGSRSCEFEHTILITKDGAEILTK